VAKRVQLDTLNEITHVHITHFNILAWHNLHARLHFIQSMAGAERELSARIHTFGQTQDRITAQMEDEIKVRKRLRRAQLLQALQDQVLGTWHSEL
jgi:hypothetical protein